MMKALHEVVRQNSYESTNDLLNHDGIAFEATTIAQAFESARELDSQSLLPSLIENLKYKAIGLQNS